MRLIRYYVCFGSGVILLISRSTSHTKKHSPFSYLGKIRDRNSFQIKWVRRQGRNFFKPSILLPITNSTQVAEWWQQLANLSLSVTQSAKCYNSMFHGNRTHSRYSEMFFFFLSAPHRFLRERRACSKSLVSRATQTIVSAWAPAAVARIRARNCADHWAPPPCSRCVARRRHRQESCAPWKRAKARAWSRATSALRRWSCACSRAFPSSSPACYSTSSWSEGILIIG